MRGCGGLKRGARGDFKRADVCARAPARQIFDPDKVSTLVITISALNVVASSVDVSD